MPTGPALSIRPVSVVDLAALADEHHRGTADEEESAECANAQRVGAGEGKPGGSRFSGRGFGAAGRLDIGAGAAAEDLSALGWRVDDCVGTGRAREGHHSRE